MNRHGRRGEKGKAKGKLNILNTCKHFEIMQDNHLLLTMSTLSVDIKKGFTQSVTDAH